MCAGVNQAIAVGLSKWSFVGHRNVKEATGAVLKLACHMVLTTKAKVSPGPKPHLIQSDQFGQNVCWSGVELLIAWSGRITRAT